MLCARAGYRDMLQHGCLGHLIQQNADRIVTVVHYHQIWLAGTAGGAKTLLFTNAFLP